MKKITLPLFLLCSTLSFAQGVGINATSAAANPSAMLDVDNANRGVLLSRVSLTATNVAAPITAPANSLLVFNLASAGVGATAVSPGFYYWNAPTSEWIKIIATNGSVGNDNQDLTSATLTGNNLTIAIQNGAPVTVDLSSLADADSNPANEMNTAFSVVGTNLVLTDGGGTFTLPIASIINAVNAYNTTLTVSGGNLNLTDGGGTLSVPLSQINANDWKVDGNAGTTPATNFLGTTDNQDLVFRTNNTEKARVTANGNVGLGTVPLTKLHISESSSFDDIQLDGFTPYLTTKLKTFPVANLDVAGLSMSSDGSSVGLASWPPTGKISFFSTENHSAVSKGTAITFSNTPNSSTTLLERMRINDNGYVGIGTVSPATQLDVFGPSGGSVNISTNGRIQTGDGTGFGGVWLNGTSTDAFVGNFGTSFGFYTPSVGANALQVQKSNGFVGIGTSTPTSKLHVEAGTTYVHNGGVFLLNDNVFAQYTNVSISNNPLSPAHFTGYKARGTEAAPAPSVSGDIIASFQGHDYIFQSGYAAMNIIASENHTASNLGNEIHFQVQPNGTSTNASALSPLVVKNDGKIGIGTTAPTQVLTVYNGSTFGNYTTTGWAHSSDARLKTNVKPVTSALSKVKQINGVYYNWKDSKAPKNQIGFLAQDLEKVLPEAVVVDADGAYSVVYGNVTPLLVEGMKEQQLLIEELKKQVEALKLQNELILKKLAEGNK
jgi:Chaperone of endosialidase